MNEPVIEALGLQQAIQVAERMRDTNRQLKREPGVRHWLQVSVVLGGRLDRLLSDAERETVWARVDELFQEADAEIVAAAESRLEL